MAADVIAQHHFTIETVTNKFAIEADNLKPYLLSQGLWKVKPIFISGSFKKIDNYNGIVLTSPNVTTENDKRLILGSINVKKYEQAGNCHIFKTYADSYKINSGTNRLYFELLTLDGKNKVSPSQKIIVALNLIQMRPK